MPGDTTFLVEDFLAAIASQLDRTQDALAYKAVNRPLTYAIKEFNLQLQVFVEMSPEGNVRLRSSGPNEAGASSMNIGFTTITRPMIEENTISLSATRAPSLAEAGFDPAESQRLERLGVRNTSQLRRLGSTTGATAVSRLTEIPVARLRAALQVERPAVTGVRRDSAAPPPRVGAAPSHVAAPTGLVDRLSHPTTVQLGDSSAVHIVGKGLANEDGVPAIRLDGELIEPDDIDWDRIVVAVPAHVQRGMLEVIFPNGEVAVFDIVRAEPEPDQWTPEDD